MAIPKIIHQIFLSGPLPNVFSANIDRLRERNPAWEHRLYIEEDAIAFIRAHYGKGMEATYRMINKDYGAARADLLRHLIIYKLGGVYLDIKSTISKPLDEVLRNDDVYLLSQWDNGPGRLREGFGLHPELSHVPGGEFQTHALIAAPDHPFSKAAIDRIVRNIRNYRPWSGVGKMGVIRTTGPSAYTLAVHEIRSTAPHRVVTEDEIGLEFSISEYDHGTIFPGHYSTLTTPVVALSWPSRFVQRIFETAKPIAARLARRLRGHASPKTNH